MPDTTPYLILGLVVFAIILSGFLLSLVVRFNNVRKDIANIEALANE